MALIIHRTLGPNKPQLYAAQCMLELHTYEREQLHRYGAAPLVRTRPGPVIIGAPTPHALLTDNQLLELIDPDGLTYQSFDLREVNWFVDQLRVACEELWGYWKQAAAFTGTSTLPMGDAASR
jgi:hypothetical protein